MRSADNTVFVAGGAAGLGAATARQMAAAGSDVLIFDRDAKAGQALADELRENVAFVAGDIMDAEQVRLALRKARSPVRLVVITAFTGDSEPLLGVDGAPASLDRFRRVVDVNLMGTFNVLRLAAAHMAQSPADESGRRGLIVLVSSITAHDGMPGALSYTCSKAAVGSMALPVARELAPHGIRVMCIAPGSFDTASTTGVAEEFQSWLIAQVPHPRRLGLPNEFARLTHHLLENDYLNGAVIRIDGAARLNTM